MEFVYGVASAVAGNINKTAFNLFLKQLKIL